MLWTTDIDHSTANPLVSENITIDGVDNNEVDELNIGAKMSKSKIQDKIKEINLVKTFLAKSQASIQDSRSGFLTSKTRQTFTELRQAFRKAPIFHHFDQNCHIWNKTDVCDYTINRDLS